MQKFSFGNQIFAFATKSSQFGCGNITSRG